MKKTRTLSGIIALAAVTALIITGCAGLIFDSGSSGSTTQTISIRTEGNLSTVLAGGTLRCSATGQNIAWAVSSTSDGSGPVAWGTSISSDGLLMAGGDETLTALYVIATSTSSNQSAYKQIRIVTVTGVAVSPSNQQVISGNAIQYTASVMGTNNPDTAVTWKVSSNPAGNGGVTAGTNIDAKGLLTVAPGEKLTTLYVFATSVADPTKSGSAYASIVVPIVTGVAVSPPNQSATSGSTLQFSATVMGTNIPNNAVTWRVSSNPSGSGAVTAGTGITANGLLTVAANETISTLYIFATSAADTTKSGSAYVSVIVPIVTGVVVSPPNQMVTGGGSLQYTAAVTGSNNPSSAVTWKVSSNPAGNGAVAAGTYINANGLLTVAANETTPLLYVIATSVVDPSRSGNASVTVSAPVVNPTVTSVTVRPSNQQATSGSSLQFSATVTGTNNPSAAVTWRVSSNAAGTGSVRAGTSIDSNGLLTIAASESARTLYVFATSAADPTKSGNASVSVSAPVVTPAPPVVTPPPVVNPTVTSVTVRPSNQQATSGSSLQFTATVTGTNNPDTAVTWRVGSTAAGTGSVRAGTSISGNGLLTIAVNETARTLYVFATSVADPTKSGNASVTVTAPVVTPTPPVVTPTPPETNPTVTSVTISPSNPVTMTNRTVQFTAAVAGTNNPNTAVTWKVSSNAAGTGAVASRTTISANGLLTIAPNESAITLYVTATSVADPAKSGSTTVTVSNNQNQGNQGNRKQ